MFKVSNCKVSYFLALITLAILGLATGSWASSSLGDDDRLRENKNLASFAKRNDGLDLMAVASAASVASASATASSSSQQDDKDLDDGQRQEIAPAQKRPISEADRPSSRRNRDRDRANIDRVADNSRKDVRDDVDYEDEQRDQRQSTRGNRGRDRSRSRGQYNGNNRSRLDEEDNEEPARELDRDEDNRGYTRGRDRGYDRCRRCNEDYEDRRLGAFGSLLEPMFDMIRRMPSYPPGEKRIIRKV